MKNNYFTLDKIFVNLFVLMISALGFSQACPGNQIAVSIQNLEVTATAIEYDLYVENTGTTSLRFVALQGSILYDETLLPLGATGTLSVVTSPNQTPSFQTLNDFGGIAHTVASRQLRWTQPPVTLGSGNTVVFPSNTPLFYARFRFESSMPWTMGDHSLSFWTGSESGYTTTSALVYCNGNTNSTVVSSQTGGAVFANRSFTVTPETLTVLEQQESITLLTPNPFTDHFNLDIQSNSTEEVQLCVYDLLGRKIEEKMINPLEMTKVEMGGNYPSGHYIVKVVQGKQEQSHKMIKQ